MERVLAESGARLPAMIPLMRCCQKTAELSGCRFLRVAASEKVANRRTDQSRVIAPSCDCMASKAEDEASAEQEIVLVIVATCHKLVKRRG
jgi:hypothetical protein